VATTLGASMIRSPDRRPQLPEPQNSIARNLFPPQRRLRPLTDPATRTRSGSVSDSRAIRITQTAHRTAGHCTIRFTSSRDQDRRSGERAAEFVVLEDLLLLLALANVMQQNAQQRRWTRPRANLQADYSFKTRNLAVLDFSDRATMSRRWARNRR